MLLIEPVACCSCLPCRRLDVVLGQQTFHRGRATLIIGNVIGSVKAQSAERGLQ